MVYKKGDLKKIRVKNEYISLVIGLILVLFANYIIFHISTYLLVFLIAAEFIYVVLLNAGLIGNALHVTKESLPRTFSITEKLSKFLGVGPKFFIQQSPQLNAFTIGITNPSIVITSGLYDILNEDELTFIIGHEMGHVFFKHNIIKTLVFPAGNNIPVLEYFFNFWGRDTEYTADRIGLVCCNKIGSALSAITKLTAGEKVAKSIKYDFLEKQEFEIKDNFQRIGETLNDHPYNVKRLNRLILFDKTLRKQ